jgi:HNH endonuclease
LCNFETLRLLRAGAPLSKEWDGLVPENGMRQYNGRLDPHGDCITDDMANAIAMRADIHRAFDECRFILVRKDGLWVARFLELTYELGRMHHNRPPELKPGVSAMFLLVRLAWAIFPHARACLEAGGPKLVRV